MATRTRGFEAEVDGAIYSSTVTHSGPLREPADKHSICTIKKMLDRCRKLGLLG